MKAVDIDRLNATADRLRAHVEQADPAEDADHHRNVPQPDLACLYGLVGDIARAASATTEANPYAVALNAQAYIGCCLGRGAYMPVGNTRHHPRLFGLHVGRSSRGRKGEAMSLLHRIDMALRAASPDLAPQVHRGGLSSREGLAYLIHDGFCEGRNEVKPIHDKRLWIIESEFANVLQQTKRDGNTLSAALRDCWDGVGIKPATKSNRISASHPHISLSAAVTPAELLSLIEARELSNGFANRFIVIFNERQQLVPFPRATPQSEVDGLAARLADVLRFCGAERWVDREHLQISLTPEAAKLYGDLYRVELNRCDSGPMVASLLERRAPVLLRIAMLFALTDKTTLVNEAHIMAALAWVRYWSDSVKFIFSSAAGEDAQREVTGAAAKIADYLREHGRKSRTAISTECFHGKLSKDRLDDALSELLQATPPTIIVESEARKTGPGTATKFYVLAAKSAKCEEPCGFPADFERGEVSEMSEVSGSAADDGAATLRSVRSVRQPANCLKTRAIAHTSLSSLNSPTGAETGADEEVI